MVAYHLAARPDSRLFHGRLFFLGGSSDLEQPAPGVRQGDLSGIAAKEADRRCSGPTRSPRSTWPSSRTGTAKLARLAERSLRRADHAGRRRAELAAGPVPAAARAAAARRPSPRSGPTLEVVVHGGVKFDPYREAFAADPRQPADPAPGDLPLLGGVHRLRRPGDRPAAAGLRPRHLLRVRPGRRARLGAADPALAGERPDRGQLRDRRLDLRGAVGARHRRHGPVRVASTRRC